MDSKKNFFVKLHPLHPQKTKKYLNTNEILQKPQRIRLSTILYDSNLCCRSSSPSSIGDGEGGCRFSNYTLCRAMRYMHDICPISYIVIYITIIFSFLLFDRLVYKRLFYMKMMRLLRGRKKNKGIVSSAHIYFFQQNHRNIMVVYSSLLVLYSLLWLTS